MYPGILSGLQQPGGSPFDTQPMYPQPFGLMPYGGGGQGGHMGMPQGPGDIQKQKGMLDYLAQLGGSPAGAMMLSKFMGGGGMGGLLGGGAAGAAGAGAAGAGAGGATMGSLLPYLAMVG